ncbi:ribosomal protein L30p/L7e [Suhomyces tanzawaensis NRRL Y-17324]|uniref:Ribosomal protein L30p/L7e n=1 Tax=Suhomyces tanzawaensis NRRL Y-17324 TaxID=984487 RepID=A0A1E4SRB7_9ASCO|nr:ribosomal protein L30p/L7e [Suhomyces tanzawaensis NRRL Y-17324]ODV82044.1 ribosomal protein L30p/L7e [Suhomyces tanzawaensis NRRL Y-17324]
MAVLNSNPEILLRKRKDKDRKRLQKQEEAQERIKKSQQLKKAQKNNFIRAETLVSRYKANELERKRISKISSKNEESPLISEDGETKLLFVIRTPNHVKGLTIPVKARQILAVLKLQDTDTGVFVKATPTTMSLLNLIAPYIIVGRPSLSSIRQLFQKRARIISPQAEEGEEKKPMRLDNNQLVEDKFGDSLGLVCIEDIIHELLSLSDNFVAITSWLLPFKLNAPVNGWGPQAKLARLLYEEANKKSISLSKDFKIKEVEDIDSIIAQQN